MLELIKKGKKLSKDDMASPKGGAIGNCGTANCACGTSAGNDMSMYSSYLNWKQSI
jgi:hypothetical protein